MVSSRCPDWSNGIYQGTFNQGYSEERSESIEGANLDMGETAFFEIEKFWEIGDLFFYFSDEIFKAFCIFLSNFSQLSLELLLERSFWYSAYLNSYSDDQCESGDSFSTFTTSFWKLNDFEFWFLEVWGFLISICLLRGLGHLHPALAYHSLSWDTIFQLLLFRGLVPCPYFSKAYSIYLGL